jgi:DNA uptake protein ComE-like DNA-binding protein
MASYHVHSAYISSRTGIVTPGIYDESLINLDEARTRSTVTLVDAVTAPIASTEKIENTLLSPLSTLENFVELVPTVTQTTIKKVPVNSMSEAELMALPHVGKVVTSNVLKHRPFKTVAELNQKAPLPRKRRWEDTFAVQIELPGKIDSNSLNFTIT